MKKTIFSALFLLVAVLLEGQTPRLVIPFGHSQGISSAAFSPDGQRIVTGGRDGTAKLWDLKGRLIQTFAAKAAVMAIAFSPDGKSVLTGSTDHTATLWSLNGQEQQSFIGHNYWVEAVAFSPDGKTILTGGTDGTAKLWDLNGNNLQTIDIESNGTDAIRALAFSPDGRTVLIGSGELEGRKGAATLWSLPDNNIKTFTERDGEINAVAFSPDGKTVLTGSKHGVKLWDLAGHEKQTFTDPVKSVLTAAFSPDGKTILTGHRDGMVKLWGTDTGEPLRAFNAHTDWITTIAFSPAGPGDPQGGKYILTSSEDGTAKLWSHADHEIQSFTGHTHKISDAAFSPDGRYVWTHSEGVPFVLSWALTERDVRPQVSPGRLSSFGFYAMSPDGKTKLVSDFFNYKVTLRDTAENNIQTFEGHNGHVAAVAFSPDGKTVLTGSADGTAKLWNLNGQVVATLIILDSTDWVITTPNGLFDASPGAMRLMYFVVGLEVIELEQLKERYFEPGLLPKIMGFSDEPLREVEGFDSVALYPEVRLQLDTLQNKLRIHLAPRNGGVGKVSVFVNDKEVLEEANKVKIKGFEKTRDTSMTIDLEQYARYFLMDTLNTISIRAFNEAGWLKSAPHTLDFWSIPLRAKGSGQNTGKPLPRKNRRPALYVLAVGTADYAGTQLDLKYSGKDAKDITGALRQIGAKLFSPDSVFIQLLTTDTSDATMFPTRTNIKAAFDTIKAHAKAEDMLLVYLSGHGVAYNTLFYYLTMEAGSFNLSEDADAGVLAKRTVSSAELTSWINNIPAQKQVLILDACNSGKVVENLAAGQKALGASQIRALDRMKDRTGMFVLTGSAADKVSYEAGQFGQGLLTYSILQGMKVLGNEGDSRIDVMSLFQHAREEVPGLAKGIGGIQTPMLATPLGGGSFDIGISDSTVHIPIAQEKQVFIRNVFQDEDNFDDRLGLTNALKAYFYELTARGDGNLIYVDVSEYDNAYSIKGLYRINGDDVEVRGKLFNGKASKGDFLVTGKKDDLPGLAQAILEKVTGMLE